MTDLDHRTREAVRIGEKAGAAALEFFNSRHELVVESKGLQDFVSIADKSVEDIIRRELVELFPQDQILGEEGGGGEADRLWVIDPIDGTSNFLRGIPYWGVVIAYVVDGVTQIGVTVDPVHDEVFVARRGGGATRNGEPIVISNRVDGDKCVSLSFNFKQEASDYNRLISSLNDRQIDHRRTGSTALNLCHVADGRTEGMLCLHCNSWDCLAGLILVEEAGGIATSYTDGCSLLSPRAVAAGQPALEADLRHAAKGFAIF